MIFSKYLVLLKKGIGKIIGIDISGIIMIIIELIILRVIYFINSEFAFEDNEDNEYIFESGNVQINSRNLEIKQGGDSKDELIEKFENNDIETQPEVKEEISLSDKNNKINNININVSKDNQEQKENTLNKPGNTFGGILQVSEEKENKNIPNPYNKNKVNLIFEFNENDENLNSPYEIMVYINETFNNIEKIIILLGNYYYIIIFNIILFYCFILFNYRAIFYKGIHIFIFQFWIFFF